VASKGRESAAQGLSLQFLFYAAGFPGAMAAFFILPCRKNTPPLGKGGAFLKHIAFNSLGTRNTVCTRG
jgi:hypothetical protein